MAKPSKNNHPTEIPDNKMGDLSDRLQELSGRISSEESDRQEQQKPAVDVSGARRYGKAVELVAEFIAGPLVGGLAGYGLDRLFGTLPIFLIILLLLGFGAGVMNMARAAKKIAQAENQFTATPAIGGSKGEADRG